MSRSPTSFTRFWPVRLALAVQLDLLENAHALLSPAQAAMTCLVLNTFIHYSVTRQTRRCRSSPPELQVHLAICEAVASANSRTPRRRRRRRAGARGDDQTLSEFRHLAICENWRLLAQRAAIQYRREVWGEARTWIIACKAVQRVPTLVEVVPHHLFKHIAN